MKMKMNKEQASQLVKDIVDSDLWDVTYEMMQAYCNAEEFYRNHKDDYFGDFSNSITVAFIDAIIEMVVRYTIDEILDEDEDEGGAS